MNEDEQEQTARPEHLPGEIVEYYEQPAGCEVVEYYFQQTPYPGLGVPSARPPRAAVRKRSGLRIFLICAAVIAALTAAAFLWSSADGSAPGDSSAGSGTEESGDADRITIPGYSADGDVQLSIASHRGSVLTAQEIYETVNPSVVTVLVQLKTGASLGTGVIFTSDGYILTNYHVVSGGRDCSVTLADDTTYEARYVAGDADNDLAVLKADAYGLPAAQIGSSDDLTVGDKVYAIGNPLGVELRGTFTDGIVSAINRDVQVDGRTMTLIQTNAALNSGNSGGPLINQYGQVVGINTIKMSSAFSNIEGLGFAIPSSSMQYIVNDLLAYGEVLPQPLLGISVARSGVTLPDGTAGITVLEVSEGSAADLAGVRVNDVIVSADGDPISASADLMRVRRRFNVGDEMTMTIYRSGRYQDVTLNLIQAAS